MDESIALVEFSKHDERVWSKPFDYAHIEVGLKIWNPHRIFWFHHPNIDRAWSAWMAARSDPPFYDFPTSGFCPGHNLHDVISSTYPFPAWLVGDEGDAPLTIAALMAATRPGNDLYTYA